MAFNKKISGLVELLTPSDDDLSEVLDTSEPNDDDKNKKITYATLKSFYASGSTASSDAFEDYNAGTTYDSADGTQYVFYQSVIYLYIKSGTSLNEQPDLNPLVWEAKTAADFVSTTLIFSGVATGTDTYALASGGATLYTDKYVYIVEFTNANTAASTLNHNTIGAKNIVDPEGVVLKGGEIDAGSTHILIFDEDNDYFILLTFPARNTDELELTLINLY